MLTRRVLISFALLWVAGAGLRVTPLAVPPVILVRAWLPDRIGLATATYSNGYVIGATLAVAFTIPLVLPLVGGSWRLDLVAWALPVIASAFVILALAPPVKLTNAGAPMRWWPDWRSPLLWKIGLLFGANNSIYFSTNTFLAEYLGSTGQSELITPALTLLNFGQIPMSLLLIILARYVENRRWPHVVSGLGVLTGIIGIAFGDGAVLVASAFLVGFSLTATFVLALALPPFLAAPADIPRLSAGMFTISYSTAVLIPTVCGLLWDLTGVPAAAFVPLAVCAAAIAGIALTLPLGRRREGGVV